MVSVVEQDHVAWPEVARRTPRDAPGRRELAPVLAPARPQQRLQAELARDAQAGVRVDPERGAVVARRSSDQVDCALDVGAHGRGRLPELDVVAVAMDADLVPARGHFGGDLRVALHLLADQ